MNARHCFIPGSSFQAGSVGSLPQYGVMTPTAVSSPAGLITAATETDTLLKKNSGFQPISATLRMACAAGFGPAAAISVSALAPCSVTICESTVGSLASHLIY